MAIIKKWKKYSLIIEGQLRYRDMYLYLLLSKKITNSSLYDFFLILVTNTNLKIIMRQKMIAHSLQFGTLDGISPYLT
jgi:hypothetical protein